MQINYTLGNPSIPDVNIAFFNTLKYLLTKFCYFKVDIFWIFVWVDFMLNKVTLCLCHRNFWNFQFKMLTFHICSGQVLFFLKLGIANKLENQFPPLTEDTLRNTERIKRKRASVGFLKRLPAWVRMLSQLAQKSWIPLIFMLLSAFNVIIHNLMWEQ